MSQPDRRSAGESRVPQPTASASASALASERRRGERRATARANRPAAPRAESWFGALGGGADTELSDDALLDDTESRFKGGWRSPEQAEADSRFLTRQAQRLVSSGQTAFYRIYRVFLGARAALGLALVFALALAGAFGAKPTLAAAVVSVLYAAQALSLWLLPRFSQRSGSTVLARLRGRQWLLTIGVDIACFVVLHLLSRATTFNYVALLVLPVLMAGVLTPRVLALATAAMVSIALLGGAWLAVLSGTDVTVAATQAGLAGSGFFVITVLAGELAGRLAREELTAKGSLELVRQQAQLNRLVIEEMQDGVLVVDRAGRVRAANPAARRLLDATGMSRPPPFRLRGVPAWVPLEEGVERAFAEGTWPEGGRDLTLVFDPGTKRTLRMRVRFTRRSQSQSSEELCVLFLEDVRSMQARTRQEKLAAMGRVSAGIAHEIRNPLAAIAQANALLSEDVTTPGQRQLTRMVSENVERLKRIVADVMEVAPGGQQEEARVIDVSALVATACSEWARSAELPVDDRSLLRVALPTEPVGAVFDEDHLRRVLVNLLDNARRHASQAPGSVHLSLQTQEGRVTLSVASDGAPIPADVERYLFEPFFSTRSRGTGLGLYICRELCERYGASIDYRLGPEGQRNRNEFLVVMRRQPLVNPEARLPLPV